LLAPAAAPAESEALPEFELDLFVIYDRASGLFSRGGTGPQWAKFPKVWATRAYLMNHLAQFYAWTGTPTPRGYGGAAVIINMGRSPHVIVGRVVDEIERLAARKRARR
jgi:hypothetical protein